jgi:peroxiredoxin
MEPEQIFPLSILKAILSSLMQFKHINHKSVILVIVLALGISIFILLKLNESEIFFSGTVKLEVGKAAPDFAFPGLDGRMISLSDHRGKVVLVNIWATWCRPCVDEMPSMEKLYQELRNKDFEILAISIDSDGAEVVASFMQEYKLTFPALIDSEGSIKESYGVTGVPESFIIDQHGILVKKIIGAADWASSDAILFFRNLIQKRQAKNKTISN